MAAHAQAVAEVPGEGPDVGSGGALDGDIDVHHVRGVVPADAVDLEPVDGDRPGGELDVLTGADPCVGAFAVDLDGADAAGHLLDAAR